MVGEEVEATGQPGRHDIEAVGRPLLEPLLKPVGDLLGRARHHPVTAGAREAVQRLADAGPFAVDDVQDQPEAAVVPRVIRCGSPGS